jgi:hypothetical protein
MVETELWRDAAFRELGTDARLLFIWLWTSPQSTIGGIYSISPRMMEQALGENGLGSSAAHGTDQRIGDALDELARKPLAVYDWDAEVVWVVNRAKYANRSPKTAIAIRREFEQVPDSPLREKFRRKYSELLKGGGAA